MTPSSLFVRAGRLLTPPRLRPNFDFHPDFRHPRCGRAISGSSKVEKGINCWRSGFTKFNVWIRNGWSARTQVSSSFVNTFSSMLLSFPADGTTAIRTHSSQNLHGRAQESGQDARHSNPIYPLPSSSQHHSIPPTPGFRITTQSAPALLSQQIQPETPPTSDYRSPTGRPRYLSKGGNWGQLGIFGFEILGVYRDWVMKA